jgi:hypothetical protein
MKSRWSWLALGVGAYLAIALATFPAGTAVRWFAPAAVAVAGVEGTLWSGSALTCSVGGFRAEAVRWRVRPWALVLGRIDATLEARIPDGFFSSDVALSPSSARFSGLRAATSLPALAPLLPVRGMRGQASVALESLELADGWPTSIVGDLTLAGLEAPPLVPNGSGALLALGDYKVTFVPAPERELAANFTDTGGPLAVTGTVELDAARAYTFDALISARPSAAEALVQGIDIMTAEPDAEGRRRLTMTGSL